MQQTLSAPASPLKKKENENSTLNIWMVAEKSPCDEKFTRLVFKSRKPPIIDTANQLQSIRNLKDCPSKYQGKTLKHS